MFALRRLSFLQVAGLVQNSELLMKAAAAGRPNVTAFAYFSSAVNPILYVFAGSSHIRQAGVRFMGKLLEATYSESTRSSRTGSSPDEGSALQMLSAKLGKSFKGRDTEKTVNESLGSAVQVEQQPLSHFPFH